MRHNPHINLMPDPLRDEAATTSSQPRLRVLAGKYPLQVVRNPQIDYHTMGGAALAGLNDLARVDIKAGELGFDIALSNVALQLGVMEQNPKWLKTLVELAQSIYLMQLTHASIPKLNPFEEPDLRKMFERWAPREWTSYIDSYDAVSWVSNCAYEPFGSSLSVSSLSADQLFAYHSRRNLILYELVSFLMPRYSRLKHFAPPKWFQVMGDAAR